jgi:hypothetical protein
LFQQLFARQSNDDKNAMGAEEKDEDFGSKIFGHLSQQTKSAEPGSDSNSLFSWFGSPP